MINYSIPSTTEDPKENFGPATALDIVAPPAALLVFIIICLLLWSIIKQPRWWCCLFYDQYRNSYKKETAFSKDTKGNSSLFDYEQLTILDKFRAFQNKPSALFKVCLPCLISIGLCPFAIFLVPSMWDFFFPFDDSRKSNINGTLSPFLLPSSLVYSLAWGFALQDALGKFDVTDAIAKHHYALLKQIRELLRSSKEITNEEKCTMLRKLGQCTTNWMLRQMGKSNHCNAVWYVLDIYRISDNKREKRIMTSLFDKVMELDQLMEEGYRGAHANITPLQWIFMEMLGFVAFFGILLINADSYILELVMCILTVFTISAFAFILSDLDHAYHGTFAVDLSVFTEFLDELQDDFNELTPPDTHGDMQTISNGKV